MMVTVINAESLGISEYRLPWLEMVEHQGEVYGLTATGLERLEGALEATAAPRVQMGKMVLVAGKTCTAHPAHLTVSAGAALEIVTTRDEYGVEQSVVYPVPAARSAKERKRTVLMGKGATGDAWQLEIRTPVGRAEAFSLSAADVEIFAAKK